jgi:hypothetical protein
MKQISNVISRLSRIRVRRSLVGFNKSALRNIESLVLLVGLSSSAFCPVLDVIGAEAPQVSVLIPILDSELARDMETSGFLVETGQRAPVEQFNTVVLYGPPAGGADKILSYSRKDCLTFTAHNPAGRALTCTVRTPDALAESRPQPRPPRRQGSPRDSHDLPRSWTSEVKSAILHVVSLAQFTMAHTRGWAANSPNSRIRLKADSE